jgi:hypothetical protein
LDLLVVMRCCQESDRAAAYPLGRRPRAPAFCEGCPVRDVMLDRETQARTSRITRFPQPQDPDGRPCLPTHHPDANRLAHEIIRGRTRRGSTGRDRETGKHLLRHATKDLQLRGETGLERLRA